MVDEGPHPREVAPRLVAAGCFGGVAATRLGTEPAVFAWAGAGDEAFGQLWDVARGVTAGPPIPGVIEDCGGAFGLGVGPVGERRPLVVVGAGRALHVVGARDGSLVSQCFPPDPPQFQPELVCLAESRGRTVVACIPFEQPVNSPCLVWDAATGALLNTFDVDFPRDGAVPDPELVAFATIPGAVLLTTQEELWENSGWPPYEYYEPYLAVIDLATGERLGRFEGGPPTAQAITALGAVAVFEPTETAGLAAVRLPDGERITAYRSRDRDPDTVAVGTVSGHDLVVGGAYDGESAAVWELARPEPIAVIRTPGLRGVAIADGTVVLATREGLYAVAAGALPLRPRPRPGG